MNSIAKHFVRTLGTLVCAALLCSTAGVLRASAAEAGIDVLLIAGQNNHRWLKGELIKEAIGACGRFVITIHEHPERLTASELAGYDVLVSNWNTFGVDTNKNPAAVLEWPESAREAYVDFVRKGGGHVVIHAGSSSFYDWNDYHAIGLMTWAKGQTKHGKVHEFPVRIDAPDHPVMRGIDAFRHKDELWRNPGVAPGAQVLASSFSSAADGGGDTWHPCVFAGRFGDGRTFATSLGHVGYLYSKQPFQLILCRGIEWAATGKVTIMPADFAAHESADGESKTRPVNTDDGWIDLFDGKTLDGWVRRNGVAEYAVHDGAIVGTSVVGSPNTFLCTECTFSDFELTFEVKCGKINSGVQIRSRHRDHDPKKRYGGPQVEIEHSPGQSGYIYGEGYDGWRSPEPMSDDPAVNQHNLFRNDEWNAYRIIGRGPRIQTWINGTSVADLTDEHTYKMYPQGEIGLQVHSHVQGGREIQWRNIRIRKLIHSDKRDVDDE